VRALYHSADVLVLDEAMNGIDAMTEKSIIEAIHNFSEEKIIVIIAH
jgi:HlyD family secretion protein